MSFLRRVPRRPGGRSEPEARRRSYNGVILALAHRIDTAFDSDDASSVKRLPAFVALVAALTFASCNGAVDTSAPAESTPTERAAPEEDVSGCEAFAQNVDNYDILAPGASREEYLTLLHQFQRDCPEQAEDLGLTGEGLPRCKRHDQENCTLYDPP